MLNNQRRLEAALAVALANAKFMGDSSKVDKAIDALTPKSTASSVLKRLEGIARRDFLDKKDAGFDGYTDETRADKIRKYVSDRFQSYMDDPATSAEAKELFNAAFGNTSTPSADQQQAA